MGIVYLLPLMLASLLFSCASDTPPHYEGGGEPAFTPRIFDLGYYRICATATDGILKCLGHNNFGQLGDGSTDNKSTPTPVNLGENRSARALTLGNHHTCAILDDHTLKCWGSNSHGQLGDPDLAAMSLTPTPISLGTDRRAHAITAGEFHTCAILDDRSLKCWGLNGYGQLGDSSNSNKNTPTPVDLGSNRKAYAIASGNNHTCAILDDHSLKCWGYNTFGQLGDGSTDNKNTPVAINLGEGRSARAIISKDNHTCAILDDHTLKCWGKNSHSQLGDGNTNDLSTPTAVPLGDSKVFAASVGSHFTCAQTGNYALRCWGVNNWGQLGDGTDEPRSTLDTTTLLPPGLTILALKSGASNSCALMEDNSLICWGNSSQGQLGFINPSWEAIPLTINFDQ